MTEPAEPGEGRGVPDRGTSPGADPHAGLGSPGGPALRRPDDLAPRDDPGDEPALLEVIRSEIRTSGPMTFARFMELALYAPGLGYYQQVTRGPGRAADFLTAPESHPIFGWSVAAQLEEAWDRLGRPPRFTVREHGAGTGALAAGIVEGLDRSGSPLRAALRYRVAERSANRHAQVEARLAALGTGAELILEPDDGAPVEGAVVANEVLDALPVHAIEGGPNGGILERFVTIGDDGRLDWTNGKPSTSALAARLEQEGIRLVPGQRTEVCLAADDWLATAAAGLRRGLMLLVDYGHPAAARYDPARGSLLRAYVQHRVHDDVLANVGRQDLTAHVDLTAAERAATAAGLTHLGTTTQAAFLAGLGAGELLVGLQADPRSTLQGYLDARSALFRMLDPGVTGKFAVLGFGRDLGAEPPLRGFGFAAPRAQTKAARPA